MPTPTIPLFEATEQGEFPLLSSQEMLEELAIMIGATELSNGW